VKAQERTTGVEIKVRTELDAARGPAARGDGFTAPCRSKGVPLERKKKRRTVARTRPKEKRDLARSYMGFGLTRLWERLTWRRKKEGRKPKKGGKGGEGVNSRHQQCGHSGMAGQKKGVAW